MIVKVYQANICYKTHNLTTILCATLKDLNEIIGNYKDYDFFERFEITITEEKEKKEISYNSLDID